MVVEIDEKKYAKQAKEAYRQISRAERRIKEVKAHLQRLETYGESKWKGKLIRVV